MPYLTTDPHSWHNRVLNILNAKKVKYKTLRTVKKEQIIMDVERNKEHIQLGVGKRNNIGDQEGGNN